ncbi:DUF4852 domain-containing protein [Marinobacter sediminum]|uniref:DUF4852 domain-containing protein n=1 Tax=Marinobacter sediminum TaxID=256323 RepID=UPI00193A9ABD|nr:DUF4852 domain-containing protein [Marinobacter sediminum]
MKNLGIAVFASLVVFSQGVFGHEFNWTNLMLASAKLQPAFDYEANVDSYMYIYRNDVWDRYRNDEFELQDKRDETQEIMKSRIDSFDIGEAFVINTSFDFGEYDFSNGIFPVESIGESAYFSESRYNSKSFPSTYRVFFDNPEMIGDLKMNKELAKSFLNSRKSSYGSVDRSINAKMEFVIIETKTNPRDLVAQLTKVTFYKDRNRTGVLETFESN